METNKINEKIQIQKDKYEESINTIVKNINKNKYIIIYGKILHYLDKPVFYYNCISICNPFDVDINFACEYIEGENPYVTVLTDFINPTLNDNRNYYLCLSKDYKYKFSLDDLKSHEINLESIINGIDNFLCYINEMIAVNAFIFFGDYEYNHIYQINDFLQYKNYHKFYRVYELINDTKQERYIIITKLYFLYFAPAGAGDDNALVKLLFCQKLKEMNFLFDRDEIKNSLILNLSKTSYKNNIEFIFADKQPKEMPNNDNSNLVEEDNNNNNNKIIETEEKSVYSILIKEWFTYQDYIKFNQYDVVLSEYKLLFMDKKINIKFDEKKIDKLEEYDKIIEFNEKVVDLYEKLGYKNDYERLHKLKSNLIYICSDLVDFGETENGQENKYMTKIRKYISSYTKNQ
jgi:hypothetical protein